MNIYKKAQRALFLKFLTAIMFLKAESNIEQDQDQNLDLMVDFAYPVSTMQSIRQNLNQSVYALQQNNADTALLHVQDACAKLGSRQPINDDDREYIREMIDQIDALIASLESVQKRSAIAELCQNIQAHL